MASTSLPLTNWLELPSDIMANIFRRVGLIDIFENVQKVCTTWHKICKNPVIWRVIKLDIYGLELLCLDKISKLAVERSQGQLVDFTMGFGNDELLQYVADRSSNLRRLEIVQGTFRTWNQALKKFPLLEELNLYSTNFSKEDIEIVGHHCPMLKTLKVNQRWVSWCGYPFEGSVKIGNEFAKAIGENLDLRNLELIGCSMSNAGLYSILDGCCDLETLDLRNCRHISLNKHLLKRCSEQIKHLKLPDDSLEGCQYFHLIAYDDEYDDFDLDKLSSRDVDFYDDYDD